MHTTPRLTLTEVDGSDLVSVFPTGFNTNMALLDGAVLYSEDTFANRPAAAVKGRIYKGTDTGLYYWDTGAVWLTVMLAGAWVSLTLVSGVIASSGYFTPSARLEGNAVRLKGVMQNNTGGTLSNTTWASLPSGMIPASYTGSMPCGATGFGAAPSVQAESSGLLVVAGNGANGAQVTLDGLSYTLS